MPRQRQPAPPPEGDEIDIAALLDEVRGTNARQDELAAAIEELRTARTPAARRRAALDVDAAEEGLVKALRQHGYHDITVDDLEELRRGRRESEFESWFDKRLQRMGDELEAESVAAAAEGGAGGEGKGKGKGGKAAGRAPRAAADGGGAAAEGGDEGGAGDERGGGYFG